MNKTILKRLDTMADQLHRATMVQDRSVHIIKQVCAINAEEAQAVRADVAALLEALEPLNWDESEMALYADCPNDAVIGEVSAGDIRRACAVIKQAKGDA